MATKVPIEIFCIGRTEVDRTEVQRWLAFLGVPDFVLPEDEAVTNPALLIALAAKRCYRSFDLAHNSNLSRIRSDWSEYLDNVMKSGHGSCLEHSVYNLAIENVSRVFTSELNRHRAGWAISEGSMRFIRFGEDVPYWEPESIQGPPALDRYLADSFRHTDLPYLHQQLTVESTGTWERTEFKTVDEKKHATRILFERSFEGQRDLYRVLEAIWRDELAPESKFAQKKQITSMMRRIIGMGVATGGVWSGNIRALRHVMTMRCEPAAEEEILHVFSRITMLIKGREPMLFGDFSQDEQGYWRPKYRKI